MRTVSTIDAFYRTYNNCFYYITFFYLTTGCGFTYRGNYNIADTCISSSRPAKYTDAFYFFGSCVISNL